MRSDVIEIQTNLNDGMSEAPARPVEEDIDAILRGVEDELDELRNSDGTFPRGATVTVKVT